MNHLSHFEKLFKLRSHRSIYLSVWKKNVIQIILILVSCFGFLIYIPSVYLAWQQGLGEVVILDTLALLLVWFLLLLPNRFYKPKSYFLVSLIFILGCLLYTKIGLGGAGILWLFLVPVFCGIFLGRIITFWSYVITSLFVFSGIFFIHYKIWTGSITSFQVFVVGANFTFLCGILTFLILEILNEARKQRHLLLTHKNTNKKLQNKIFAYTEKESKLIESLNYKETLFKEIQHRVKNNIHLILGMLNLDREKAESELAKKTIESAIDRIQSMGIVQEYLFLNDSYKVIQTKEYLDTLVNHIFLSYGRHDGSIQVNYNITEALLSVDKAIPCGLILNELMINSFKHAFPENRKGKITVSFQKSDSGYFILEIADNGIGQKFEKSKSMAGMSLIQAFCLQLRGEIEIEKENGFLVRVRFFP
ncbi:Histidine kinase [Leptospira interrogans serovar Manilae]|uniref:histidine kinase n=1 Tax=Leptospira interrogans serovar Manilae TaxID=214675 RepID=A0AAQ1SP32_LEPIR|nr:sensor histidine kinase [Leptospira interrogans]AKP26417.1 histidine kinase [Leptospira interrogans serovar Manilae]AKP30201.1 histidine kinase [Leptospira interrogans serovar Manilae]EYU61711.1 histidine kinase [Leptospira interrogans serovar Manilae]SOR62080.1 Histidine kinase [Leptospira interrogans serovar Manilae]